MSLSPSRGERVGAWQLYGGSQVERKMTDRSRDRCEENAGHRASPLGGQRRSEGEVLG